MVARGVRRWQLTLMKTASASISAGLVDRRWKAECRRCEVMIWPSGKVMLSSGLMVSSTKATAGMVDAMVGSPESRNYSIEGEQGRKVYQYAPTSTF